jgi:hypothetical protein
MLDKLRHMERDTQESNEGYEYSTGSQLGLAQTGYLDFTYRDTHPHTDCSGCVIWFTLCLVVS